MVVLGNVIRADVCAGFCPYHMCAELAISVKPNLSQTSWKNVEECVVISCV